MKFVVRQTGLKPYLIRTWEERYGAVRPQRSKSNRRLYSDADIERLILLRKAVDRGHMISTVAPLGDQDLRALVQAGDADKQQNASGFAPLPSSDLGESSENSAERVQAALNHIMQLNADGLEQVLTAAAVDLPRQSFLQHIIMPLFHQIGSLWKKGRLKIVNEHLASVTVRAILWDMLRTVDIAATAPRIVVATPVGHWHELGALASALAASESGWRAFYFGPNLPPEEIAYAVHKVAARALCLSLCHQIDDSRLPIEIEKLRRSVGMQMPLFVGGAGSRIITKLQGQLKISIVDDLDRFRRQLEAITDDN